MELALFNNRLMKVGGRLVRNNESIPEYAYAYNCWRGEEFILTNPNGDYSYEMSRHSDEEGTFRIIYDNCINGDHMFDGSCFNEVINGENGIFVNCVSANYMFSQCTIGVEDVIPAGSFNNVINGSGMFSAARGSLIIPVNCFNNLEDATNMFANFGGSLYIHCKFHKLKCVTNMFSGTHSKLRNLDFMLEGCDELTDLTDMGLYGWTPSLLEPIIQWLLTKPKPVTVPAHVFANVDSTDKWQIMSTYPEWF